MYWPTAIKLEIFCSHGNTPGLLAQADAPSDVQQLAEEIWTHFNGGSMMSVSWILAIAAVLLTLIGGLWLWRMHTQRRLRSAPLIVFHGLASEVGLTLSDQWLLARVASHAHLPSPITLLLSSATLRHHGQAYVQSVSPHRKANLNARIERIARELLDVTVSDSIKLQASDGT